jgi:hypothetical protein
MGFETFTAMTEECYITGHTASLLGSAVQPQDGIIRFLRKVSTFLLHPRR